MDEKPLITLVTGGARSGKSSFGESLLSDKGLQILYIATALIYDIEMEDRVKKHRGQRPDSWHTIEEYKGFKSILPFWKNKVDGVLLDCVTLMVTQLMLDQCPQPWEKMTISEVEEIEQHIQEEMDELLNTLKEMEIPVVIITNEVGLGIVPGDKMSRDFRDIAGRINQRIAAKADAVHLVIAGIPMRIK